MRKRTIKKSGGGHFDDVIESLNIYNFETISQTT